MTNDLCHNIQRGYLPDGKDRQHPVRDPDDTTMTSSPVFIAMFAWHSEFPIYQPIGWLVDA
jgi:hypothetical protein